MSDTAVYVYGIVPADVEVQDGAEGIGDPPAAVELIREGDVAALVSAIPKDQPLGAPHDLQAHAKLLDGTAAVSPVLPLRFGSAMADADSVATELLRDHHDEFADALQMLEGRAEYVVRGRYDEEKFLSALVDQNDRVRALRDEVLNTPQEAARTSRMALGELIANEIEATRRADSQIAVNELKAVGSQVSVQDPTHEWDAVNVAVLADVDRQPELEDLVHQLQAKSRGLIAFRLLGPLAPYDFVVTHQVAG